MFLFFRSLSLFFSCKFFFLSPSLTSFFFCCCCCFFFLLVFFLFFFSWRDAVNSSFGLFFFLLSQSKGIKKKKERLMGGCYIGIACFFWFCFFFFPVSDLQSMKGGLVSQSYTCIDIVKVSHESRTELANLVHVPSLHDAYLHHVLHDWRVHVIVSICSTSIIDRVWRTYWTASLHGL